MRKLTFDAEALQLCWDHCSEGPSRVHRRSLSKMDIEAVSEVHKDDNEFAVITSSSIFNFRASCHEAMILWIRLLSNELHSGTVSLRNSMSVGVDAT